MNRSGFVWCMFVCACTSSPPSLDECVQLKGDEIAHRFSGVVDNARVQDGNGGRATNHWYANGRFTSEWTTANASGTLTGHWHVKDDLRCVVIDGQMPDGSDRDRCGPLYQCGDKVVSVNADGGIHGVHRLNKLSDAEL